MSGLEEITLPPSMEYIGPKAFSGCRSLRHLTLAGDKLTAIKEFAFMDTGIESFVAPPILVTLGTSAF